MERTDMAKQKNEMTSDDLMQLPDDIAGLVLDVQGRQAQTAAPVQKEQEEKVTEPAPTTIPRQRTKAASTSPKPTALPKDGNLWWNTFLNAGDSYDFHVRKPDRKSYWVDEDIANTLKACDINHMSMSDKINAILRSFIELNKEELRQCFKKRDSLL